MRLSLVNLITQFLTYFAVQAVALFLGFGEFGAWITALAIVIFFCPPFLIIGETK